MNVRLEMADLVRRRIGLANKAILGARKVGLVVTVTVADADSTIPLKVTVESPTTQE